MTQDMLRTVRSRERLVTGNSEGFNAAAEVNRRSTRRSIS